jgi:hypothetical protein
VADTTPAAEGNARRSQSGGAGRGFTLFLVVVLLLGLSGLVLYLLSEINARRYRLAQVGYSLVVEQGRFLPVGFTRYVPRADALKEAYAPIPMPPGARFEQPEVFDDRADLDRALFALLAGFARQAMSGQTPAELQQATLYIDRCQRLPGLSEQQRLELKTMRADLAYRRGRYILARVGEMLTEAENEFRLALELGTSQPTDAQSFINEIETRRAGFALGAPSPAQVEQVRAAEQAAPGGAAAMLQPGVVQNVQPTSPTASAADVLPGRPVALVPGVVAPEPVAPAPNSGMALNPGVVAPTAPGAPVPLQGSQLQAQPGVAPSAEAAPPVRADVPANPAAPPQSGDNWRL